MVTIIEEIKQTVDLLEYVQQYTELKRSGAKYKGKCPFPDHTEKTASFYVMPDEQKFKCFGGGCGRGGDILDFVCAMENYGEGKDATDRAINLLCERFGLTRHKEGTAEYRGKIKNPKIARKVVNEALHECLLESAEAMQWLAERDVDESDVKRWKIGMAWGTMLADLKDQITVETLMAIGIVAEDEDSGRRYDYIKRDTLTFPVHNDSAHISHWHLRYWRDKKKYRFQIKDDHRNGGLFFNQTAIRKSHKVFLVEGPFEVIQLEKRGYSAVSFNGTPGEKQLNYLQRNRVKAVNQDIKNANVRFYYVWLDRDEELAGQKASERVCSALCKYHKTVMVNCPDDEDGNPVFQDPDDYLRGGGSMEALDMQMVHHKKLRIEETDRGYVINKQDKPQALTDFCVKQLYHYIKPDNKKVRYYKLFGEQKPTRVMPITGEQLASSAQFRSWLYNVDNYNLYGGEPEFKELVEYLFYTDISKEVRLSKYYGNILENVWLFDNGIVDNGQIYRANKEGIIWYDRFGFEGVKITDSGEFDDDAEEEHKKIVIPPDGHWFSVRQIVKDMLTFYPSHMVRTALGYAVACIFRMSIARFYKHFPMELLFGDSQHGKTVFCNVVQSLLGCSNAPTDSCTSTTKAYMRHLVRYKGFPLHLSEYNDKFRDVMKNLFDLIVYSQAKKTSGYETRHPPANAATIFTCEKTPSGQSLLNRCVIVDFSKFEYDDANAAKFDRWLSLMAQGGYGIGFLLEVLKSGMNETVMNTIQRTRELVVENRWEGASSRIIWTYSVVYGCFCSLYEYFDLEDIFRPYDGEITWNTLLKEIKMVVTKAEGIVAEQDKLRGFMSIAQTLFLQGKVDAFVQERDFKNERSLCLNIDGLFNEVLSYDRRSRGILDGVQLSDITHQLRDDLGIQPQQVRIQGDLSPAYVIPVVELNEAFGLTFSKAKEIMTSDMTSIAPEEDETIYDDGGAPF